MSEAEAHEGKEWHRVEGLAELPEGRVMTASIGQRTLRVTHHNGEFGALDNRALFAHLGDALDPDAVVCVDVGNNAHSLGRYLETRQGQDVLMSGYLGSIGFALPAAMGAWAAVGDQREVR